MNLTLPYQYIRNQNKKLTSSIEPEKWVQYFGQILTYNNSDLNGEKRVADRNNNRE